MRRIRCSHEQGEAGGEVRAGEPSITVLTLMVDGVLEGWIQSPPPDHGSIAHTSTRQRSSRPRCNESFPRRRSNAFSICREEPEDQPTTVGHIVLMLGRFYYVAI